MDSKHNVEHKEYTLRPIASTWASKRSTRMTARRDPTDPLLERKLFEPTIDQMFMVEVRRELHHIVNDFSFETLLAASRIITTTITDEELVRGRNQVIRRGKQILTKDDPRLALLANHFRGLVHESLRQILKNQSQAVSGTVLLRMRRVAAGKSENLPIPLDDAEEESLKDEHAFFSAHSTLPADITTSQDPYQLPIDMWLRIYEWLGGACQMWQLQRVNRTWFRRVMRAWDRALELNVGRVHPQEREVELLFKRCPSVLRMELKLNITLRNSALLHLTKYCRNIQQLDLSVCTVISDKGLETLKQLPLLHTLFLTGSRGITDLSMPYLAKCKSLENLDLSQTKVTDRGLRILLRRQRKYERSKIMTYPPYVQPSTPTALQYLRLFDCKGTSDQGIEWVKSQCVVVSTADDERAEWLDMIRNSAAETRDPVVEPIRCMKEILLP